MRVLEMQSISFYVTKSEIDCINISVCVYVALLARTPTCVISHCTATVSRALSGYESFLSLFHSLTLMHTYVWIRLTDLDLPLGEIENSKGKLKRRKCILFAWIHTIPDCTYKCLRTRCAENRHPCSYWVPSKNSRCAIDSCGRERERKTEGRKRKPKIESRTDENESKEKNRNELSGTKKICYHIHVSACIIIIAHRAFLLHFIFIYWFAL